MNRPGIPGGHSVELCSHGWRLQHGVVVCLGFGGWDVADGFQKSAVVEPVDRFQGGELNGLEVSPSPAPAD